MAWCARSKSSDEDLGALGHDVRYATPEGRFTLPLPTYPEIRLAVFPRSSLEAMIDDFAPDAIHIATEGTLGLSARARSACAGTFAFTTSFHTRFPEYVHARLPFVPEDGGLPLPALVPWAGARDDGGDAGACSANCRRTASPIPASGRAASMSTCSARSPMRACPIAGPIWLYVGRVAVEKNLDAFLALDLPGTKVVMGDGPARATRCRSAIRRPISRREDRRRAGAPLRGGRRVRVSEQDRHLRAGDAGGAGLRRAGGGLSGAGPMRRDRRTRPVGGAARGSGRGLRAGARDPARGLPRPLP